MIRSPTIVVSLVVALAFPSAKSRLRAGVPERGEPGWFSTWSRSTASRVMASWGRRSKSRSLEKFATGPRMTLMSWKNSAVASPTAPCRAAAELPLHAPSEPDADQIRPPGLRRLPQIAPGPGPALPGGSRVAARGLTLGARRPGLAIRETRPEPEPPAPTAGGGQESAAVGLGIAVVQPDVARPLHLEEVGRLLIRHQLAGHLLLLQQQPGLRVELVVDQPDLIGEPDSSASFGRARAGRRDSGRPSRTGRADPSPPP